MNIAVNIQNISSIDPSSLSENDLNKIHELEQDMWAHGLGEYLKCNNCGNIYSKKEIFGHLNDELYFDTVNKIENILGIDEIECKNCGELTEKIYGEKYLNEIIQRYQDKDSFLTVYRDNTGEIRGFTDGYISDFNTIYYREFEKYYYDIGVEKIILLIKEALIGIIPDKFLLCSSIGLEGKFRNNHVLLELYRLFHKNVVDSGNGDLIGIYNAVIGSRVHKLYSALGAKQIGIINEEKLIKNSSENYKSDIFIHYMMSRIFSNRLSNPTIYF